MPYTHIVHLGDIHIRCGKEEHSRFKEYSVVFQELQTVLQSLPCIQEQSALIVVCGDIFHHKYKLEAYSVLLWNTFIQILTQMAPVVVICGNHDYRQEDPDTPDLIDVMFNTLTTVLSKYPCQYLKNTGTYVFDNIEFGLVSIKDTLNAFNTQGMVETLPPFPKPSHPTLHSVALFHGTITQSALPNGQLMSAGKGYPLEWFKGYQMLLLGDNHKQQIHQSSWGLRWGYPGSLVQQDIGEPVQGHGFLLWDLNAVDAVPYHIYNPYGRMKLKWDGETLSVKLRPVEGFEPIEILRSNHWFPKYPHFVLLGSMADEWKVVEQLKRLNITYSSVQATSTVQTGDTVPSISNTLENIHQLNNPKMWLEYIQSKDAVVGKVIEEERWIETPSKLLVDCVPQSVSKELHELSVKYRQKLEQLIKDYERMTEAIRQQRHTVVLKHMSWDWVYSYGAKNHFQFERIENGVGLLNGKNASGKSAFIDALCIGLFGEPSLNRQLNQTKKMDEHCIHSNRPKGNHIDRMNVKLIMSVDGELYELERHYKQSASQKESGICSMDLYRIDATTNERVVLRSGSIMVNEWVKQHIGTIEDLMKTSIVCQMDNNNFFFAKPDEQKAMIDSAVNLKELQAFSELIHESLLQHQNLLKTVSMILQISEEMVVSVMSMAERQAKESQLKTLGQQCQWLEHQKDACMVIMNSIQYCEPAPEETRTYWEARQATDPHWRDTLAECRNQRAILTYELSKYNLTSEEIEALDADVTTTATTERLQKKLTKLLSKKPPSSRSKTLLHQELEKHHSWIEGHQSLMDDIAHRDERMSGMKQSLETLEYDYTQWVKKEPIPHCKSWVATDGDGGMDGDWDAVVDHYETLKHQYNRLEHAKKSLDSLYSKEAWEKWVQTKAEYDDYVVECRTNEWTNEQTLDENRKATRTYLEKRRILCNTINSLESQLADISRTLGKHGDWETQYDQWKVDQESIKGLSIETLEHQKTLWETSVREKEIVEEQLKSIQQDPWWDEWKQWNTKYKRCLKHQWVTVESVQKDLEIYEDEKLCFVSAQQMLETLGREREGLRDGNPHPECSVCQTRLSGLNARIQENEERLGEWTLEKLDEFINYYQKGLNAIQWVETFKESMKTKHDRYRKEQKTLDERQEALTETIESISIYTVRNQCERYYAIQESARDADKYEWLHSLSQQQRTLEKQLNKIRMKLTKMQSEEELLETEHYWKRAVDVFTKVTYQTPAMEREQNAWECAKERWAEIEALPVVTEASLKDAWEIAYSSWVMAGERIKKQREDAVTMIETLESFQDHWETHRREENLIQVELQWAEATELWEQTVAELQKKLLWKKERLCATELEQLETYEHAERWVKWYEYRDLQRDYDQLQFNCQELREQLAIDDDHCERNGGGRDGDEGGDDGNGDDGFRGSGYVSNRKVLKRYQSVWSNTVEMLTVMDKYLVGEKGKQKKDGGADTFKEWVYQHHVLPMLEQHINDFLRSVGVELAFCIEYGKKALLYKVKDRGNETSFAASSGFQQFIIGLGMRHALGGVGGTGNNLQHLFIDEGFTACDAENLEKAFDILQLLIQRGHYKSILLISHLEPIQEMVSLKIPLERKGGFTKLAYGAPYPTFNSALKRKGRPPKNKV